MNKNKVEREIEIENEINSILELHNSVETVKNNRIIESQWPPDTYISAKISGKCRTWEEFEIGGWTKYTNWSFKISIFEGKYQIVQIPFDGVGGGITGQGGRLRVPSTNETKVICDSITLSSCNYSINQRDRTYAQTSSVDFTTSKKKGRKNLIVQVIAWIKGKEETFDLKLTF